MHITPLVHENHPTTQCAAGTDPLRWPARYRHVGVSFSLLMCVSAPLCTTGYELPNVGREQHTFAYHVLHRWDQLAPRIIFSALPLTNHSSGRVSMAQHDNRRDVLLRGLRPGSELTEPFTCSCVRHGNRSRGAATYTLLERVRRGWGAIERTCTCGIAHAPLRRGSAHTAGADCFFCSTTLAPS